MLSYWINSKSIKEQIFIPKYYDPEIREDVNRLSKTHFIFSIGELESKQYISVSTGDEIGKLSYGTGSIPFVRTSDISNWEIKSIPKQGISEEIYNEYCKSQDVKEGDILLVRDGTYLIGTNCFITYLDKKILYQSHILKFRIIDIDSINPYLFFLALNSSFVQRQIRNIQFTADIIDTIGNRYKEIFIPIPKDISTQETMIEKTKEALESRVMGKAFIKQCPFLIEETLKNNNSLSISSFSKQSIKEIAGTLKQDTVTAEFGEFEYFWHNASDIKDNIFIPKYYEPSITKELSSLEKNCFLLSMKKLKEDKIIDYAIGDEIGKMSYGTGEIPFIRTSDFSNWEIKHDPKQGISEDIYNIYKDKQDVKENDILLVKDGTYLIGNSCIITKSNSKSLFCAGLYKIRVFKNEKNLLDPFLLLGLLNSYIVKRQIRTKQFTRDVIDTIGARIEEVIIPIPKSKELRKHISDSIKNVVNSRINGRNTVSNLSKSLINNHSQ